MEWVRLSIKSHLIIENQLKINSEIHKKTIWRRPSAKRDLHAGYSSRRDEERHSVVWEEFLRRKNLFLIDLNKMSTMRLFLESYWIITNSNQLILFAYIKLLFQVHHLVISWRHNEVIWLWTWTWGVSKGSSTFGRKFQISRNEWIPRLYKLDNNLFHELGKWIGNIWSY